jgi:hypothetical protein
VASGVARIFAVSIRNESYHTRQFSRAYSNTKPTTICHLFHANPQRQTRHATPHFISGRLNTRRIELYRFFNLLEQTGIGNVDKIG